MVPICPILAAMWMILLVLLSQALDRPFPIATPPSKLNSPFRLHAMMQSEGLSSMCTATTTCNKGALDARFLVQADDCFMIQQDWILKPIGNESKRTCPWQYGKALSPSSSCLQRFGRYRSPMMINCWFEDLVERMTQIRPPYCKGFNICSTGRQPNEDIWQHKQDSLRMFLAGKLSTCCIGLPQNSSLAPCLRSTEINCCKGSRKLDLKIVQGHESGNIDRAPPLGKTSRKWSFKYGLRRPHRCRRQRKTRSTSRWRAVLQGSSLWKQMQLNLLSTRRFFCTLTCHPQSSDCVAAKLVGLSGIATFSSTMLSSFTTRKCTRSGPKSGVRAGGHRSHSHLQKLIYFLVTTSNFSGSNDLKVGPSPMGGPGAPILGAKPHGNVATSAAEAARKRSFRRAVHRASNSRDQATWYRGRYLTLTQLGATSTARPVRQDGYQNKSINAKSHFPRLRIITWNCGGLHDTRYREITQWLCDEYVAGRPVHVMVVQETAWKQDMEYKTSTTAPHGPQWYVLHSGSGTAEGGIMIFGVYQHAWNVQKKPLQSDPVEISGVSKAQQLLQRRRKVWRELGTWIAGIPRRNGCIVLGDFNTPAQPVPSLIGEGIAKPGASTAQTDHDQFLQLVRTHACSFLNT